MEQPEPATEKFDADAAHLSGLLMRCGLTLVELPITAPELHRRLHDNQRGADREELVTALQKRGL